MEKRIRACASLVGASGSHWPTVSLSLMAAMENCEGEGQRRRMSE
jgi:hypothetical protein